MRRVASKVSFMILAGLAGYVMLGETHQREPSDPTHPSLQVQSLILLATANYKSMGLVDDWARWAPELCGVFPAQVRMSAADDVDWHGRKLYYLYAKHHDDYCRRTQEPAVVGQTIVKESWHSVELRSDESIADAKGNRVLVGYSGDPEYAESGLRGPLRRWAEHGGKRFRTGQKSALFVMIKVGSSFPENDQGWIYGTTDSSGQHVTAGGLIASCMGCHVRAPGDRLFGIRSMPRRHR